MDFIKRYLKSLAVSPVLILLTSIFVGLTYHSWNAGRCAFVIMLFCASFRLTALLAYLAFALSWCAIWYPSFVWGYTHFWPEDIWIARILSAAIIPFIFLFGTGIAVAFDPIERAAGAARVEEILRERRRREQEEDEVPSNEEALTTEVFNPYDVLQVAPSASPEEVKAQYRHQMALYHPDKVQHLGADLQALANQKCLEIQRAFQMLYG